MLIERWLRAFVRLMHFSVGEEGGGGNGSGDGGAGGGGGAGAAGGTGSGAQGESGAGEGAGSAAAGGAGGDKSLLEQLGSGGGDDTAAGTGGTDTQTGGEGTDKLTTEQRALQAAEKDTRRPKHVPAKYWDTEKGEVKLEAWAKSTQQLEARMRDVGLPPETADAYKFDVPKELKEAGVDLDPAMSKAFRDQAHKLGLTQKQYEGVMGAYFQQIGELSNQTQAFSTERAKTELLGYYKTEDALKQNVRLAYKAFSAYADEKDMELINSIGNIPAVIRVLAKVGKELGEDPGVAPDAILDGESLEQLMRGAPGKEDSPYWNKEDPRHKQAVAKVMRHHEAAAAARRRKAA